MHAYARELLGLYRDAHRQMRANLEGLDAEALNWVPGQEMNSITVLVTHVLAVEADTLLSVRGLPSSRDRAARALEFEARVDGPAELYARLDAADALLEESLASLTDDDLDGQRARPGRDPQPGRTWLLGFFGHLREHLAHLEMTKQLWQQRQG